MENKLQTELLEATMEKIKSTPLSKEFDKMYEFIDARIKEESLDTEVESSVLAGKMFLDEIFGLMKESLLNAVKVSNKEELKLYLELVKILDCYDIEMVTENMNLERDGFSKDESKEIIDYYLERSSYIYDRMISLLEALINY